MRLKKSSFVCIPAHAAVALLCLAVWVAAAPVAQAQTNTVNGVDGNGNCGTVNLTNGQWTEITGGNTVLAGIGPAGGTLYGGAYQGGTLYQVDPTTCIYTAVGNGSISGGYKDFGATGGMLYGISPALTSPLYSVDPGTGATTFIGSTNLPPSGSGSFVELSGTVRHRTTRL